MAERLLEDTGLELKAAFESEFYVTNDGRGARFALPSIPSSPLLFFPELTRTHA